MWFLLTWAWTLTQALHDLQVPDLGETISSHSRVSNHEESPQTIILQHPRYQSRTVEISSEIIAINGNVHSRPTILESQQVKETLLRVTNSTASFMNLAFKPLTTRILTVTDGSECLVANSVISVIEDVSPIECSDSTVQVVDSEFDFASTQNRSPSLSTTSSLSSSVLFHSCSFSDVLVTSPGSLICCSSVQTSQIDHCDFRNISHYPTFLQSSFSPLFHNVSVLNSHFSDCENVLFGGVVRDTEDRTSLLAANTTFTRSRSTYTNRTGETFGPIDETAEVVTVDHRYRQCTFTQCVSVDVYGGAIRCNSGANLAVDNCTFIKCHSKYALSGQGGGISFDGDTDKAGVSVTRSIFSECEAVYGGAVRFIRPSHLVIQFCNTSKCCAVQPTTGTVAGPWGGGIGLTGMPVGAVLSNVRFEDCKSAKTASCMDNNFASGSITFSNLLFARGECQQGNVIFSHVNGEPEIAFFSCTFFSNVATATREGTVNGSTRTMAIGNDIRFSSNVVWERVLKSKSSFVNCFSTSNFPRIALDTNPLVVDFSAFQTGNETLLDIHLPTPGIVVSAETGRDGDGCGSTGSDSKCQSIGFTGKNRLADADTTILVEGGRYEETISFNVGSKPAFFSSNGDEYPIVSFSPPSDEDSFMALGVGKLSLSLFTFVPCETASIVKVVGAGTLTIESCQFQNEDGLTPIVKTSIITMKEGTALLKKVTFVGISFNQGSIVKCSGDVTKLEIQECVFTGMSGTAGPLISFERSNEGGEFIVNESKLHGSAVAGSVGGIATNNIETVTITSSTFASLATPTQKAAIDIASCTSLTLASLLFERCIGKSASDIFVTNSASVSLSSPLSQSFSASRSPTSLINGVASDNWLTRTPLAVDGTSGSDEEFCWKNVGCSSITSLLSHVDHSVKWNTTLKEETVGDSAISISNNLQLTMTGTTQAGSILSHTGLVSSPLLSVASGSLSVSQLTLSTNKPGLTRTSSFFVMTGGSLSLTSVTFPSLSFSNSGSMLQVSGTGSLSVSSVTFFGCSTDGVGSVLHSTSSGTISLNIVSLSGNKCGSGKKGRSIAIESTTPIDPSNVVMTNVQIASEGNTGDHEVFLKGSSLTSTVTSSNFGSTLGSQADQTVAKMKQFFGEDTSDGSMSGPLSNLLYRHSTGPVSVDASFWDHGFCGLSALPCKSVEMAHSKVNEADQTVDFVTDVKMTGTIVSKSSGSIIKSSSGKKMTADSTSQFVIGTGKMRLESLTLELPSVLSQALFVVSGGTLDVKSTVTLTNPTTTSHSNSLLSMSGGTVALDGTKLTTTQKLTLASSALIVQSKGSLTISNMKIENVSRTTGDGSVISATLSANTAIFSIESTNFASCSSSAGNGGALAVTITSGSFSLNKCRFESCSSGMDGGAVWLDLSKMPSPSQYSLLQTKFGTGSSANKASGKGDCVFVMGENLLRVIVGSLWRGSFETAGEDDLWGRDKSTSTSGMSLLGLLQSQVMGVGEGGSDEAAGTMDDPFETLRRCFVETEQSDGSFAVVVVERTRIGESCWLVDQPGWTMSVSGGGGGSGGSSQGEVLCRVSDEEKKAGTASSSPPHAMVTLSGQTLSFFDILFSSFSAPRSMGFVFSLLVSSHLTLSSCSLSSSSPVAVSLVSVSGSSSFSADNLSIRDVSFVGKAGLMKFVEASRIGLTSCSFSSISLEGGALMWGTTRGGMAVTNTDFLNCNGKEFGSVIRTQIVGITASITNSHFTSCSTEVRMGEKGGRDVVGGGCVVVEMMTRTSLTRHLPSSCVDFSLSSFSDCTLTNTDTSSSPSSLSSFVGGSGFLIFGNENSDCVILQKMKLSHCLCAGFGKMNGFDGGVVVGRRHAIFTDRRDSWVGRCQIGSIQVR